MTELGRKEHFELGQRLYKRLKSLFHTTNQISIVCSGKKRATDSSEEFLNGIVESSCSMDINRHKSNKHLLYFHKTCTNYLTFRKTNLEIKTILNSIKSCQQTRHYAQQILKRIYRDEFVDLLINNSIQFSFDDHHDPKETIPNEVAIVLCLYSMFAVAPAQNEFYLSRMLAKYFTEEESNWFAFINDAQVSVFLFSKLFTFSFSFNRNFISKVHQSKVQLLPITWLNLYFSIFFQRSIPISNLKIK